MKKTIRLTENDIHRIVKNSVKRVLREDRYSQKWTSYDSGNENFDMLATQLMDLVEDLGISMQYENIERFQNARGSLRNILSQLERGIQEAEKYDSSESYAADSGEQADYSGGSLY